MHRCAFDAGHGAGDHVHDWLSSALPRARQLGAQHLAGALEERQDTPWHCALARSASASVPRPHTVPVFLREVLGLRLTMGAGGSSARRSGRWMLRAGSSARGRSAAVRSAKERR